MGISSSNNKQNIIQTCKKTKSKTKSKQLESWEKEFYQNFNQNLNQNLKTLKIPYVLYNIILNYIDIDYQFAKYIMHSSKSSKELQLLSIYIPMSNNKTKINYLSNIRCKFYHRHPNGCMNGQSCPALHTPINLMYGPKEQMLISQLCNNITIAKSNLIYDNIKLLQCIWYLPGLSWKFNFETILNDHIGGTNVISRILFRLQMNLDDIQAIHENIKIRIIIFQLQIKMRRSNFNRHCFGCSCNYFILTNPKNYAKCSVCNRKYFISHQEIETIYCKGVKCKSIEYNIPDIWIIHNKEFDGKQFDGIL